MFNSIIKTVKRLVTKDEEDASPQERFSGAAVVLGGKDLDPDAITKAIGIKPHTCYARGSISFEGDKPMPIGLWVLKSDSDINNITTLEDSLRKLVSQLEPCRKELGQVVAQECIEDAYLEVYFELPPEALIGIVFPSEELNFFTDIGLYLSVQLYV